VWRPGNRENPGRRITLEFLLSYQLDNDQRNGCEAPLKILQKYLLREWFWTFLAVTVVLIVVMFGVTIGDLLGDVADGRLPPGLLGNLMLLRMPEVLSTIIPLAIFIAIVWGLGRLYRDQEMAVMRASGFNWRLMLRPLSNLLLPVAILMFIVGVLVTPKAADMTQKSLREAFRTAAEWGLQTGKFHVLRGGDLILYVESVEKDGRTLKNIFIQQRQNGREQIWIAEKGYYWLNMENGERFLTLENGQITEGGQEALDFGIMRFSRNDLRLPVPEDKVKTPDVEVRPSTDIAFSTDPAEAAEFQWRLSPAISVLILGLLAIPLSHSGPREGRAGRVIMSILAYAIYANLLYMSRGWITNGTLPPALGMYWVHLLTLTIAIIWVRRQHSRVGSR